VPAGQHERRDRSPPPTLGYPGWFVSPIALMVTTAAVVLVMWWRQFKSEARRAMDV
jgi:uncharacterized membrane protein